MDVHLDLSDASDLMIYLADTPFASHRVQLLAGGNTNFVSRLYLRVPYEGHTTVVLKHAKPYAKFDKNFSFDVRRQVFEAVALRRVRGLLPEDALVMVPKLFHYDDVQHALIMEDSGLQSRTLKAHLLDPTTVMTPEDALALGTAIGYFLSVLHIEGSADRELMNCAATNDEGKRLCAMLSYGGLVDKLHEMGPAKPSEAEIEEIRRLADETSKMMMEAEAIFTMGDFWTGNMIVRTDDSGRIIKAFVVDWEACKPGLPYLDFGQFLAEMHCLRFFYPHSTTNVRNILLAYSEEYRRRVAVDDEYVRRALGHVGSHLVAWTRFVPDWKPEERVVEALQAGAQCLVKCARGETVWLRGSAIGDVFHGTSCNDVDAPVLTQ